MFIVFVRCRMCVCVECVYAALSNGGIVYPPQYLLFFVRKKNSERRIWRGSLWGVLVPSLWGCHPKGSYTERISWGALATESDEVTKLYRTGTEWRSRHVAHSCARFRAHQGSL